MDSEKGDISLRRANSPCTSLLACRYLLVYGALGGCRCLGNSWWDRLKRIEEQFFVFVGVFQGSIDELVRL
jgi:hypothetical protein